MNRLKQLRVEKGLLQSDIAKVLGVSDRAVGFYESGKRDMGTETLGILSNFFEVTIDYLLGKSDEKNPKETDPLGLAKIGFNMKDYNPPSETQKQQIKGLLEVIMKDNKKDVGDKNNESK